MSNQTPNYNLVKPLTTENYDVNIFNGNADIIDTTLKSQETSIGNHINEKVFHKLFASRDAQTTGLQTISLPFTPKYVKIIAEIDNTSYMSIGETDGTDHSCLFTFNSTGKYSMSLTKDINMHNGAGSIVSGTVTIVNNGINITWDKTGTEVTGNIAMIITAITH